MNVSGIYTALSGMNAQKRVLDVTAHNVANVSTPGYHRQRVNLEPAGVTSVSAVFAGRNQGTAGVNVVSVERVLDDLAESRLLRESAMQAHTSLTSTTLDRIELAFPEPSDLGIAALLDDFWAGWSDLSTHPDDLANRTQLLERSSTVIDALRRASVELDSLEQSSRESVVRLATDINDIAGRIATLNRTIVGSATGANDLLDQRDQLVTQLAQLSGAVSRPAAEGGQIDVYIGGRVVVSGPSTQTVDGAGGVLRWSSDGAAVTASSSSAAALRETIDDTIPRYRIALDEVARSLVESVNAVHTTGYDLTGTTGRNFFDPAGLTAATISLSADVAGQPDHIAAAAPGAGPGLPGRFDGELARSMAGLAEAPNGPDARYRSMVSTLGVEVRTAVRRDEIQGQLVQAAANRARFRRRGLHRRGDGQHDGRAAGLRGGCSGVDGRRRDDGRIDRAHRGGGTMNRVTNSMTTRTMLRDLNLSLGRLQDRQADLSTGRVIRKVSDDPTGAVDAMALRNQLRRADQRSRSLDDAQAWLQTADTALVSGLDMLSRVKELAVRASNTGVTDPSSQSAIAAEIGGLRDEMLAIANTKYLDRPVFNGTAVGEAYHSATGAYLGNDATVMREVAPGTVMAANLTGEQVFGAQAGPDGDLFAVLDRLRTAIQANDPAAIGAEHARLDTATKRLASAAAEIGTRAGRIDNLRTRASVDEAALRERLSGLEDADLAEALLNVRSSENAYNAALQAAGRVLPASLLDYLR